MNHYKVHNSNSIRSTVLEKIVLRRLFEHIAVDNLLAQNQHGFLSKRVTSTALMEIVAFDCLEEGKNVCGIFPWSQQCLIFIIW